MLHRIKLLHHLGGIVVTFWVAFLAIAALAGWGLIGASRSLHTVHDRHMMKSDRLARLELNAEANRTEVMWLFQHDPGGVLLAAHDHPAQIHLDAFARRRDENNALWTEVRAALQSDEERRLADAVDRSRVAWVAKSNPVMEALRNGDYSPAQVKRFLQAARQEGDALQQAIGDLRRHQHEAAKTAAEASDARLRVALMVFVVLGLTCGLPGTLLSIYTFRRLRNGLAEAQAAATAVAEGDLTRRARIDGEDEIGELLTRMERMRTQLTEVIGRVHRASDSIEVASTEVAAGNADLSQRTEQTAAHLQQTASSATQLGGIVGRNAEHAREASRLAADTSEVVQRGGAAVTQVVQTMQQIRESSQRIADITGVIDGIAFQTNILALNAAVEAARAGEQGRGFAVVASEVRSLAQRSAEAAREIKSLIGRSVERVEDGTRQADAAGHTMQEVVQAIGQVTTIVGEISQASAEQSEGVTQVGQAVGAMDSATQQNAALVEQNAATAESLRQQARELVQAVGTFRIDRTATPA